MCYINPCTRILTYKVFIKKMTKPLTLSPMEDKAWQQIKDMAWSSNFKPLKFYL